MQQIMKLILISFLFLSCYFGFAVLDTVEYAPIVNLTNLGLVRGIVQPVDDAKLYLYQGIRFGRANRFEKAKLAEPWTGVYEATHLRDNCPQPGLEPEKGYLARTNSEDCLLLNVWRPIEEKSNRSVMFYIFGGGFKTGSIFKIPFHDGRFIAHRGDVIVVSINYRLGAFGFMYGDEKEAPANLGLHDQILGLEWVRQNIHHFGGNPNSVTIFGNSAGSMCVGALILSPLASGLFQRAILQSGVPIGMAVEQKAQSLAQTHTLAKELSCDNPNMSLLISCLKTKSMDQILNATKHANIGFIPVYGDEFLPVRPIDALAPNATYHADIDLLYGITRDEASAGVAGALPQLWNDPNYKLTIDSTRALITKMIGKQFGKVAADFYLNRAGNLSALTQNDMKILITKALGDFTISCPVILFGEHFARHPAARSRHFYSWMLTRPAAEHVMANYIQSNEWMGVRHADELFLLFIIVKQTKAEDIQLSHQFIQAWVNFAKNADPGVVGNVRWTEALAHAQAVNNSTTSFMALDYVSRMDHSDFYRDTCQQFWKDKIFV